MDRDQREALKLSDAGRFDEAEAFLRALIERRRGEGGERARDHLLLGLVLFNAGRLEEAAGALEAACESFSGEPSLFENRGVVLLRLGRPEEAARALERARALGSGSPNVMDGLAHCYCLLGRMAEAKAEGVASLLAKDRQAAERGKIFPLPGADAPAFDPTRPEENIISFSLWGSDPRYTEAAVRNALLAPELYPGWRCRFYLDDSVPNGIVQRLKALNAQVVARPRPKTFFEGLLWRFEVVGDPKVKRFLIRDADAVINIQERVAVDAWLQSGRFFHIMRDWITHTDLILAGLWGGVGGALPPLPELVSGFKLFRAASRTFDQDLLRFMVWPTAKQSCLIHDSYFDCLGSEPFPVLGRLPAGLHVGQDSRARRVRSPQPRDKRR